MFGIFKKIEKLEKLQNEFDQYKYDQDNKPLYRVGQKLSDGTIITKADKYTHPMFVVKFPMVNPYTWNYEGLRNGEIVRDFIHIPISGNDFKELQKSIEKQNESIRLQDSIIQKLKWQINNPPRYKIGDKHKNYGQCTNMKICDRMSEEGMPTIPGHTERFYYKYTFTKNKETITIC